MIQKSFERIYIGAKYYLQALFNSYDLIKK